MTISSLPRTGIRPIAPAAGPPAAPLAYRPSPPLHVDGDVLAFAPGLRLVERDDGTLQIGTDPAHCILVRRPPPATAEVLRLMDRGVPRSMAVRRVAGRLALPTTTWNDLIGDLADGGFLVDGSGPAGVPTPPGRSHPPRPAPGMTSIVRQQDPLADAVVVVLGTGRVASSLASLLAAAGTGHVHLDPDRAIRPGDAAPAGLAADRGATDRAGTVIDLRTGRPRVQERLARSDRRPPGPQDRDALAAVVRRSHPGVSVHRPAGYVRPGLVVVATDAPPDPVLARGLVSDGQPHLAVHAGLRRGVIGPLVLPGRSSCLHCHDLFRRDRDAGWPRVRMALQGDGPTPPVVLATSVAAVAADQVLQFLTGPRPAAVDGTLELADGDWVVRRRSWRAHPGCFCHSEAGAARPSAGQEQ